MSEGEFTHESINEIIKVMKKSGVLDTKKVSDRWHTFGQLYFQRLILFSIICEQNKALAWKSRKHFDEENDPMFEGDFIVGLDTPLGPAAYHFKIEFWDLFDVKEIAFAPQYDGYSPEEALGRFRSILPAKQKRKK